MVFLGGGAWENIVSTKVLIFINMEQKECRCCKKIKSTSDFYPRLNRTDGLDSYCKQCTKDNSKISALDNKRKWFNEDGYISEKEHFNAAIKQYSEVFNLPSLLRHLKP